MTFEELKIEADTVHAAFMHEFKPFERFVVDQLDPEALPDLTRRLQNEKFSLSETEKTLNQLAQLKSNYTGKKSDWSVAKKRIGKIADVQERAWAGQHLQYLEISMNERLERARLTLEKIIEAARDLVKAKAGSSSKSETEAPAAEAEAAPAGAVAEEASAPTPEEEK